MCLVMTNLVDILAARHVKQGIESGGNSVQDNLQCTIILSNPTFYLLPLFTLFQFNSNVHDGAYLP